jgi:DNA-binding transcriptional regulator PaaX
MFEQAILTSLGMGTIMALTVCMPNSMRLLKTFGWIPTRRDPKYTFGTALGRLHVQGLIILKDDVCKITDKGKNFLWKLESKYIIIEKPKRWDKRWRLIMFDIKEQDRFQRDAVRVMLQNIGCVRLQNSVWVFPYDCEEAVTLLKANYKIGEELLYVIADEIGEDSWLRKHFKL